MQVVCHHDDGRTLFACRLKDVHDVAAGLRVEVTDGFVSENHLRVVEQGSGYADTLLFTARKFMRVFVGLVFQSDQGQIPPECVPDAVSSSTRSAEYKVQVVFEP